MKNNFLPKFLLVLLLGVIILGFVFIGILQQPANPNNKASLNIYQQPNKNSTILARVQSNDSIIGIYQKGAWVKIANTSNGNVGWMQYPDFSSILNPQKSVLLSPTPAKKKIQLDKYSQQALELQQQLNTELRTQPDLKEIEKMNSSYESQLIVIQKMIKNMQADLKHYQ